MTKHPQIQPSLDRLGIQPLNHGASTGTRWIQTFGEEIYSYSPADGKPIASIRQATWGDYESIMEHAHGAFKTWRVVPAPKRGEIVRQIGEELRKYKEPLGQLVSYETGKIYQEGLG